MKTAREGNNASGPFRIFWDREVSIVKRFLLATLCASMLLGAVPVSAADEVNAPPTVIPAVREWEGGIGRYVPTADTAIVYPSGNAALEKKVEIARGYFRELLGLELHTSDDPASAKDGDIVLKLDDTERDTLGADGYLMDAAASGLTIAAPEPQGLFYGLITAVQSLSADGFVPVGRARDYAYYPIRSGMIDVARAYLPLAYVEDITKYYAYFKLNEIHLHINDIGENGYFIFRLESDVEGLTATDGFYSKADYRAYQKRMLDYGVTVITEIDTPAHSACFKAVVPELMLDDRHLDVSKPETVEFIKNLFDEYITGDDPVFVSKKVHIGTDEYPIEYSEQMRAYIDALIRHVNSRGYTPRFWGSFGNEGFNGTTPVSNEAEANFWAVSLSDYKTLFEMGYDIINTCGPMLYVVPGGNYGFVDYYNLESLYGSWYVNYMGTDASTAVDPDHPQLKGASFALWNDRHTAYGGFSMFDIFDRLRGMVCLMAEKTWCGEQTREIEPADFVARYETLSARAGDANPGYVTALPIEDEAPADVKAVGFPYLASLDVRVNSFGNGADLLAGDVGSFYVAADGRLGFRREVYDFSYDYKLPLNEWVNIKLWADNRQTVLIIDDTYFYYPNNNRNAELKQSSTFVLPLERICEGLDGEYRNLKITENDFDLDARIANRNLAKNRPVTVSALEVNDGRFGPENAVDGSADTRLSFGRDQDVQWLLVDLGSEQTVDRVVIDFFEGITEYKLYASDDGETFTELAHVTKDESGAKRTDTVEFEPTAMRYIKYEQLKRFFIADWQAYYSGGISEFSVYGFDLSSYQTVLDETEGVTDRDVRVARAALVKYLQSENIFGTHADGLRGRLEAAYAAYLAAPSQPEESAADPQQSDGGASQSMPETAGKWLPWAIAGAAAVVAAAVGVTLFCRRKKKGGQ